MSNPIFLRNDRWGKGALHRNEQCWQGSLQKRNWNLPSEQGRACSSCETRVTNTHPSSHFQKKRKRRNVLLIHSIQALTWISSPYTLYIFCRQKRPRIQPPQKQTTTEGESSSSIQPSSTPLQQQPTIPPQQKHELKAQVISSSSTLHTSSMGVTLQDPAQLLNATTQAAPAAAIQHIQPNAPRLL